ncbi:hypothetical protein HK097_006348 [Rhizophlyctis rosea]|uniref:Caleosin n=1 Tax=Rhizophlyctis rosea TaxID=64517 RepID=A0AAD5SEV4_9FUNG|nr:hypothetical protein HK097_006348 [Rhizophlyctis rosea]
MTTLDAVPLLSEQPLALQKQTQPISGIDFTPLPSVPIARPVIAPSADAPVLEINSTQRDMTSGSGKGRNFPIVTQLDEVPVTTRRSVKSTEGLDAMLPNPGLPRANIAVDAEHSDDPKGRQEKMSVLQRHCKFFAPENSDYIYPSNTFSGFRALGFPFIVSALAMFVVNAALAVATEDNWSKLWTLRINIKNIDRCKHGSDSGTYDTEGRYVPQKFEEMLAKYSTHPNKAGLYLKDIHAMVRGNMLLWDFFGWSAATLEWVALWYIAKDSEGLLTKEAMRSMFDGTLFEAIKKRRDAERNGGVAHTLTSTDQSARNVSDEVSTVPTDQLKRAEAEQGKKAQ